jgi:hypothetical protein
MDTTAKEERIMAPLILLPRRTLKENISKGKFNAAPEYETLFSVKCFLGIKEAIRILPCVYRTVAVIVKNIDKIFFCMFHW